MPRGERKEPPPTGLCHLSKHGTQTHESALACIGDSASPWNSHEVNGAEETLPVCRVERHQVRTGREAAKKDPLIKNDSTPIGASQFEPSSWLMGRGVAPISGEPLLRFLRGVVIETPKINLCG